MLLVIPVIQQSLLDKDVAAIKTDGIKTQTHRLSMTYESNSANLMV